MTTYLYNGCYLYNIITYMTLLHILHDYISILWLFKLDICAIYCSDELRNKLHSCIWVKSSSIFT